MIKKTRRRKQIIFPVFLGKLLYTHLRVHKFLCVTDVLLTLFTEDWPARMILADRAIKSFKIFQVAKQQIAGFSINKFHHKIKRTDSNRIVLKVI